MAVMLSALYKALLEPNEDNARKAAEEVASYENKIASFESKMDKMQGDLNTLKWMVATLIVLTVMVLGKLITVP